MEYKNLAQYFKEKIGKKINDNFDLGLGLNNP